MNYIEQYKELTKSLNDEGLQKQHDLFIEQYSQHPHPQQLQIIEIIEQEQKLRVKNINK